MSLNTHRNIQRNLAKQFALKKVCAYSNILLGTNCTVQFIYCVKEGTLSSLEPLKAFLLPACSYLDQERESQISSDFVGT